MMEWGIDLNKNVVEGEVEGGGGELEGGVLAPCMIHDSVPVTNASVFL